MRLNKDGTTYCFWCKKNVPVSHFVEEKMSNGKIYFRCNISLAKVNEKKSKIVKKKFCKHHKKLFPLEHFIPVVIKNNITVMACKENYENNGGKIGKGGVKGQGRVIFNYEGGSYNKEYQRNKQLLKNYNITLKDYDKMFEEQNGCCGICGKHQVELKRVLFVDHNHDTGEVRGLLCQNCNLGLGMLKDDINIVTLIIKYLEIIDYEK